MGKRIFTGRILESKKTPITIITTTVLESPFSTRRMTILNTIIMTHTRICITVL